MGSKRNHERSKQNLRKRRKRQVQKIQGEDASELVEPSLKEKLSGTNDTNPRLMIDRHGIQNIIECGS